jgi:hypothetical protein
MGNGKKHFLGYKSGKTQSGQNCFANFISNQNSMYFSVYYLLFLEQVSQTFGRFRSKYQQGVPVHTSSQTRQQKPQRTPEE